MQDGLSKKNNLRGKNIGKSLIFKSACFIYSFFQSQKRIFPFKKIILITIIFLFILFSYSKVTNIDNSLAENMLNKIFSQEKVFVEKGLPKIQPLENSQSDFHIVAQRENDIVNLSEDAEISLILGNSILIAPETKLDPADITQPTRTKIETYVVQPGDTISTIAEKFGLQWSTILWENDLSYWSVIRPGDELKILPVNGITHHVKSGENLSYLAQKYSSTTKKIALLNNLSDNSILQPGEKIIIPDGSPPPKPKPVYTPPAPQLVQQNYSSYWNWRSTTKCYRYVARQCTDWVAFQWADEKNQCVPKGWGNAKTWFRRAKKDGYDTGSQPRPGAIMSLTCSSWVCGYYGHVAYVENFDTNTITISEMNGLKRRAYSIRTLKNITGQWQNGWKILGYIYPR